MKRILVVEDEPDAAESFALLLGMSGHTVQTVGDGLHAIDAARDFAPDVAFVDIGLPSIDGYEVARRLRQLPGGQLLLIALSGYGEDEDKQRAFAAGFDHHLTKPVEFEQVKRLLATS